MWPAGRSVLESGLRQVRQAQQRGSDAWCSDVTGRNSLVGKAGPGWLVFMECR